MRPVTFARSTDDEGSNAIWEGKRRGEGQLSATWRRRKTRVVALNENTANLLHTALVTVDWLTSLLFPLPQDLAGLPRAPIARHQSRKRLSKLNQTLHTRDSQRQFHVPSSNCMRSKASGSGLGHRVIRIITLFVRHATFALLHPTSPTSTLRPRDEVSVLLRLL